MKKKWIRKGVNAILFLVVAVSVIYLLKYLLLDRVINRDKNQQMDVAVVIKSTASNFWKEFMSGVDTAAAEYNVNFYVRGPENEEDYEAQIQMINQAIHDDVDVIILSAVSAEDLKGSVERAKQNGIKVVIVDSGVDTSNIDVEIGTDNLVAGTMLGDYVSELDTAAIKVGIVNFDKNSVNGQEREQGFREAVASNPSIEILDSINVDSNISSAKQGTMTLLERHPEINVIVTMNEWTTLGVGYAIKELECAGSVQVYGFDSNTFCLDMLETGYIDGLLVQNPYAMGYLAIECGYKLYHGEKLGVERIDTSTVMVSRENMYDSDIQKLIYPIKK